jgi:hypothetical protein
MASSIQSYKGRRAIFNGLDLIVVVALTKDVLCSKPDPRLSNIIATWGRAIAYFAPGVVTLHLDNTVNSPFILSSVRESLSKVVEELAVHGEKIPASFLSKLNIPGVIFYDYKADFLYKAAMSLRDLLSAGGAEHPEEV